MLKRLRMVGWKSFENADLALGPFTLLVGANASGKSNVREALRFLHAVGRGYNLAEIFGGKWSAGERQWNGIRGGVREAAFRKSDGFKLEIECDASGEASRAKYHLSIDTPSMSANRVRNELLESGDSGKWFEIYSTFYSAQQDKLWFKSFVHVDFHNQLEEPDRPWLVTAAYSPVTEPTHNDMILALSHMRFIDPSPEAMRQPSMPGQTILSDRGENLSSVLQSLCSREDTKSEIIRWLRALTPMDVSDLKFDVDRRGQVLLILVENDGTEISADSASEGTLRFLGLLAALMSPEPGLYFFEEIENGLHPSRIRLLMDLIQQRTGTGRIQVVATTHSPALLALLPDELLEYASLVVRPEEARSSRIVRLLDVPDAQRVLRDQRFSS